MAVKVVVENSVLRGSRDDTFLQKVATVYVDGEEYRVLAPPRAMGDALEWVDHFAVRKPEGFGTEIVVTGAYGVLVMRAVKEELEKLKAARPAAPAAGSAGVRTPMPARPEYSAARPPLKRSGSARPEGWTRGEKIAIWALIIAALTFLAALLVVPEFRKFLHLDSSATASSTRSSGPEEGTSPGPRPGSPEDQAQTGDSIATQVKRAQPPIEFDFPATGDKRQKLTLSVIPNLIQLEPRPTGVKESDLPMDVPVSGGTVVVLKFGKDDRGGYVLIDTSALLRGTRVRGEVIGYTEILAGGPGSRPGFGR